jgi:peroxiredoxin
VSIAEGDKLPAGTFKVMGKEGPENLNSEKLFKGKKVILFGLPGAFTPGCSKAHLPGFVVNADKIKARGVDTIACISVNDAFVMDAWGKAQNADEVVMLADGNSEFTKALGLEMDATGYGMGMRCKRFSMIVEDGVVKHLAVEPAGGVDVSSAEKILEKL